MVAKPNVRWNFKKSNNDFEYNTWMFLVVATKPQIVDINGRIYSEFSPIVSEILPSLKGDYEKSKLSYNLLEFDSQKNIRFVNWKNIFQYIQRDRNLFNRETSKANLEMYLLNLYE